MPTSQPIPSPPNTADEPSLTRDPELEPGSLAQAGGFLESWDGRLIDTHADLSQIGRMKFAHIACGSALYSGVSDGNRASSDNHCTTTRISTYQRTADGNHQVVGGQVMWVRP